MRFFLATLAICTQLNVVGQYFDYGRSVVDTLAGPSMYGRGYVKDGHLLAANFIANEFKQFNLKSFGDDFFQAFPIDINTFPTTIELKAGDTQLVPGKDFIVAPISGSKSGWFEVVQMPEKAAKSKSKTISWIRKNDIANKFVLIDARSVKNENAQELFNAMPWNPIGAAGVIMLRDKLTASMSQTQSAHVTVEVEGSKWPKGAKGITLSCAPVFQKDVSIKNVIGYVPGTVKPDSFLVFTAHYDHLGLMGPEVMFTGANDNASGTAMLLAMAKHYSANPGPYSMVFFATTGEEVGLLGSRHFAANPLFELDKIKFLLNLDIFGTGDEGIKVVNGSVFSEHFDRLVKLNEAQQLVAAVKRRGKAQNSDHWPFQEKGVECFFIYTLGGIQAYHDVFDRPETLPLVEFEDLHTLLRSFMDTFQ